MKTFVYVDHFKGEIQPASWEAIGLGKTLGSVSAVVFGSGVDAVVKTAFEFGADEVFVADDPALDEIDQVAAARVLAAAIQKIGDADMVVFGRQTLDNGSGLTTPQAARVLGWPLLGLAGQITVQDGSVHIDRVIEEGRVNVSAKMPVVLSVVQSIGEPRYPSFMGIRKASKADIPVWSLADLGMEAPATVVTRTELMNPPVDDTEIEMIEGETPEAIAEALVEKIIAEKVL